MNVSQMKNIVVLKDLPSNIVDEAIIILKNHNKIKKKEIIESSSSLRKFGDNLDENNEVAVKEAEFIIQDYIKKLENSTISNKNTNTLVNKYRKLQVVSILITITSIIGIILSILN